MITEITANRTVVIGGNTNNMFFVKLGSKKGLYEHIDIELILNILEMSKRKTYIKILINSMNLKGK